MSKIDKLNIVGIRSFNTQRGETIEFYTPLTLIVGVNGSGKTTIIESLKYATSGDLPPGAKKGGAFVHDPKLLGEREVMAQAKLQFKSAQGNRMVVTRRLQLTITRASRTQKALENSLLMDRNGERITISSRVAELDEMLPQYLGVSNAVLENVIFCHQEDSLWPMSEPTNLKKKFDEIFEAEKYIKAIDNIKKIRKKHTEELGKYRLLEEHAKTDRDRSEKARQRSETLSNEIEKLRTKCQDLDRKMESAREAADHAWKQSESYAKILGTLTGKRVEADNRRKTISDLREHLVEVNEPEEWLESTLRQFDEKMEQYSEEQETKQEQWLELKDEIQDHQTELSTKLAFKGKHEQEKEEYERRLARRKEMVKDAATKHQMRGYDDLSDDTLVEEFLYKIGKVSKEQSSALEKARTKSQTENQEGHSNIERLVGRKKALQDNKATSKQRINSNDAEANKHQRRADQIKVDEGSRAVIQSRIDDVNTTLTNTRQNAEIANWETKLTETRQDLRVREDERTKLGSDLVQRTKRADEVAKLAHLKQELKDRQQKLQTLMSAHAARIRELIGEDWQPGTIDSAYQTTVEEATRRLVAAERDRDAVARDIEQVQFKQKTTKNDTTSKSDQAKKYSKTVRDITEAEIEDYDSVLSDAQHWLDTARDASKGLGGLADYFGTVLEMANERNVCRVCERPYRGANDPALATFKKRLERLIKKAGQDADANNFEDAEARYKQISDLGLSVATWKRLTTEEIPALEKENEQLSQQKEKLLQKAEKHDKTVEQRQAVRNNLDSISRTVSSIATCDTDITTFNNQIEELSAKQSQQGNVRTIEDIQEEINQVGEDIRAITKNISRFTTEQDATKTQIHELEIELHGLKNKLINTDAQLESRANIVARVEEYKTLNQKERDAIENWEEEIEKIDPEILIARAKCEDVAQRWKTQIATMEGEVLQLSDTVNNLNLLNGQIKSYVDRGGQNQLLSVKKEIAKIEQAIQKADKAQAQLSTEINKIEKQLHDSKNTKREYSDNLRYRQETRALDQLQDEISELASTNAEVDRDRFTADSKRFTDQYHKQSAAREGHLGEMKTKDDELTQLIKDYETDFKDAPKRYKEAHIKVETTKAAIEDLLRYASALDKAVMQFHSLKMAQINDIVNDLWQKIYKGTDVDSILIRSDADNTDENGNARASTTTSSRRQYSYRVTMVKQGVEMDMRGRCSAGQRVLACVIIRLALAEVFSSNCGIIALDEPTTNLDRDNIQALARSLHDIIKARSKQSNFQMLIITHDEDFLRHMNCRELTKYYYRVSRDGSGDSIIERQDILMVDR